MARGWRRTVPIALAVFGAFGIGVVVARLTYSSVPTRASTGRSAATSVTTSPVDVTTTTSPSQPGTFIFDVVNSDGSVSRVSVVYEGSQEATYGVSSSMGHSANYVDLTFRISNLGSEVLPSFTPYQVFVRIQNQEYSYSGSDWALSTPLLPQNYVDLTGGPVEVSPSHIATQVMFVPTQSSVAPFPQWPATIAGDPTWCSQTNDYLCRF